MVFASPLFLFLFLLLTLAPYFALPRAWRNGVLLCANIVFYAWGKAKYLALVRANAGSRSLSLAILAPSRFSSIRISPW